MTRKIASLSAALALLACAAAHAQTPTPMTPGTMMPGPFAVEDNGLRTVLPTVPGCPATLPDGTPVVVVCNTSGGGSSTLTSSTGASSTSGVPVQDATTGNQLALHSDMGAGATGITAPTGGSGVLAGASGQTVLGAPGTISAGGGFAMLWDGGLTPTVGGTGGTWMRFQ